MSLSLGLVGAGLAGLAAGVLMTMFEIPFWKKWGMEGVAEWQVNAVMVSVLIRRFTRRRAGALMAVAMHLFHAAVLGILRPGHEGRRARQDLASVGFSTFHEGRGARKKATQGGHTFVSRKKIVIRKRKVSRKE